MNTAVGLGTLEFNDTGVSNVAIGFEALQRNVDGESNTSIGARALTRIYTGSENTAIGRNAGFGSFDISFDQCTFIGASTNLSVSRTNVTMVGFGITNAQCSGSAQVLLGNTAITQIRAQVGSITTYSDKRFKSQIHEDIKGLDFITRLRPVSYNSNPEILHQIWGTPDSLVREIDHTEIKNTRHTGLLAQEVHQAMQESGYTSFTGIDIPQNEREVYTLRYGDFIMPLVKSVQELSQQNEALLAEGKELAKRVAQLEALVHKQAAILTQQQHLIERESRTAFSIASRAVASPK